MAYVDCAAAVTANIAPDCANPLTGGYTGRAVLFPVGKATFTVDATNPRTVTAITLPVGEKWIVLDNKMMTTPLEGSVTQSNGDSGKLEYEKTLVIHGPKRGSAFAKDVVEPLAESALGFFAVVEKRDLVGNGTWEVIGKFQGLKVNPDGVVRNENENGADWVITLSCKERFSEVVFFDTDEATTRADFEGFLAVGL